MKTVLKYLRPHTGSLAAVAFMHALATVGALLMPYVMSSIVDEGIAGNDLSAVITSSLIMLAIAAASLAASLVSNKINARVTTSFSSALCKSAFKKVSSLSYTEYSTMGSSGLLTRSTDDIFNIEGAAGQLVYTLVTVPMLLIGGTVLALNADISLSLIFLVSIPVIIGFVIYIVYPLRKMWDKSDKYIDVQNRIVRERLMGIRVIRAFNNEEKEHGRAKAATEEMSKYMIRANVRSGFITPVCMLLVNLSTVVILLVGVGKVEEGIIDKAGDIVAVMQYVTLIGNALISLSWTIAWIPHLRVSISRLSELFDMKGEEVGGGGETASRIPEDRGAALRVENLSFAYPGSSSDALSSVSLYAEPGEAIAIIGGTGSGKSTLVKLLLSFYPHTRGEIFLNNIPYSELSLCEIRAAYSAALQRTMIFEGTLRDNITMGAPDISDESIMESVSDTELSDFVSEKEGGLDYALVGLGQNVSGGQKQRIGMARTVLRRAPIYIFDDSFSALDYLTERKIEKKLFDRLEGKTKILVTQRISTALAADRIYVMDEGRIESFGTHKELLVRSSIYREICESQLGIRLSGGDDNE